MKKLLAVIVCLCIALIVTVSAFAESSPESNIAVFNGSGKTSGGESISSNTYTTVSDGKTITVVADEQTYGKFEKWSFVIIDANGNETEAREGVDYEYVSGSSTSSETTIKPIGGKKLAIIANYASAVADSKTHEIGTNVVIRKGNGTREDGTAMRPDAFVYVPVGSTVTATADEATYGKFNNWSIYVIEDATTTGATAGGASLITLAATQKATKAKANTDYTVVDGSLKSKTVKIKVLSTKKLAICGNYANKITDPLKGSSEDGSPKTNDLGVMYAVITLLIAGAVVFGAKRQLSK